VVEHGPHFVYAKQNYPSSDPRVNVVDPQIAGSAKPYYALPWQSKSDKSYSSVANPWGFIHLPNTFVIPLTSFDELEARLGTSTTITRDDMENTCPPI
jgi:hypothetical protein